MEKEESTKKELYGLPTVHPWKRGSFFKYLEKNLSKEDSFIKFK